MSSFKERCFQGFMVLLLLLMGLYFLIVLASPVNKAIHEQKMTATVIDHGSVRYLNSSKYLVYCETESGQSAVYEISDSLLRFRFNSSDVYASIKPGKTYEFTTRGYRIPALSWYPNIYEYEEVQNPEN